MSASDWLAPGEPRLYRRGAVLVFEEHRATGGFRLIATEGNECVADEEGESLAFVRALCESRIARAEDPDARAGWPAEMAVVA